MKLEDSSYISKYSGHKIQRAKYKIINPEYIKWFNDIRWQLFAACHTGIAADFETTCCAVASNAMDTSEVSARIWAAQFEGNQEK